jgi:transcriptional regulator with XRE-family HTH domain
MPRTDTRPISPIGTSVADEVAGFTPDDQAALDAIAPYEEIAEQVILGRTFKNMTQRQLADAIGTSESQVSVIESGKHLPSATTLQRLGMVLDVTFTLPLKAPAAAAALAPKAKRTVTSGWSAQPAAMYAAEASPRKR